MRVLHTNITNVDQSSNHHLHIPPSQDISKLITSALSEEKEKEKRQLNLFVKESQESDPRERKESDIEEIKELFQKHLEIQVKISNAFRVGKNHPKLANHIY